jgi:hypothetical protein
VGEVKKPVILVLTAYEPVIWTVDDPKGLVVKVIASGYHDQTVVVVNKRLEFPFPLRPVARSRPQAFEGLYTKVPVTSSSYESGDQSYFFAYRQTAERDDPNLVFPNPRIQQAFQRGREREREETKKAYEHMTARVKALTGQEVKAFQGQYTGDTFEIR